MQIIYILIAEELICSLNLHVIFRVLTICLRFFVQIAAEV